MKVVIVVALALACPMVTTPAVAQAGVPGGGIKSGQRHMSDFLAEANQRVNEALRRWRGAWVRDELEELAALYTDDAMLVLPGEDAVQSRSRIKGYFERRLSALGGVQLSETDFHASGRMAFLSGPFSYTIQESGSTRHVTGTHLTVWLREGRDWKIRSQIFKVD